MLWEREPRKEKMIDCLYNECEKCRNHEPCYSNIQFCEKALADHDAKVRAEAIDEFMRKTTELHNIYVGLDYDRAILVSHLNDLAEQLKEEKNGRENL